MRKRAFGLFFLFQKKWLFNLQIFGRFLAQWPIGVSTDGRR
jgi:hypothetical protein